jgi:uncharacterized protein (TIGR01319 family)
LLAEHLFEGGLMVVEVGGATTNVHSWAPAGIEAGVVLRGLREPDLKRTVEGDLGVRWNAATIHELAGEEWFTRQGVEDLDALRDYIDAVTRSPETLPENDAERAWDSLLATFAARTAIARHCGRQREVILPEGPVIVQDGKDLRGIDALLGTGGSVIAAADPAGILSSALIAEDPFSLLPSSPEVMIDSDYALYAAGLLADTHPEAGVELARLSLEPAGAWSAS